MTGFFFSLNISSLYTSTAGLPISMPCFHPPFGSYQRGNLQSLLLAQIENFPAYWSKFSSSWARLEEDRFMGDGGTYRYRRYAVFESFQGEVLSQVTDQKHYQPSCYNRVNGGIFRDYPCFEASTLSNPVFLRLLECSISVAQKARAEVLAWHIESHQFRIIASLTEVGKPVPEGIHRDGVDFVFVFMVNRENIQGGLSRIYKPDGQLIGELKMRWPLDYMIIDDKAVLHDVTPVYPQDRSSKGFRDVLVVTLRAAEQNNSRV